jgi:four helix bundle protein
MPFAHEQLDVYRLPSSPLPLPLPLPGYLQAMPFAHEQLDVYRLALDFLVAADNLVEALPRGRGHLADQLTRASTSIVLNIAEGAGKFSKADKRRYYLTAIGSTTECAAILDVCLRLRLVSPEVHGGGKAMLERVGAMLVKLAKAHEGG